MLQRDKAHSAHRELRLPWSPVSNCTSIESQKAYKPHIFDSRRVWDRINRQASHILIVIGDCESSRCRGGKQAKDGERFESKHYETFDGNGIWKFCDSNTREATRCFYINISVPKSSSFPCSPLVSIHVDPKTSDNYI
mgnify:FL=1